MSGKVRRCIAFIERCSIRCRPAEAPLAFAGRRADCLKQGWKLCHDFKIIMAGDKSTGACPGEHMNPQILGIATYKVGPISAGGRQHTQRNGIDTNNDPCACIVG